MRPETSNPLATAGPSYERARRIFAPTPPPGWFLALILVTGNSLCSGCQTQKPDPTAPVSPLAPPSKVEALDGSVGRVVSVNTPLRFVVLDFSLSRLPQPGERLDLFHEGTIVGELKTGYHARESSVVADILQGTPVPGDEARPVRP